MKKDWTTTKLLAIGGLAVLKFLTTLLIYTTTLTVTGSIFSGFLALFISPFFVALVILITNRFGAGTAFNTLRMILELPLPTVIPVSINLAIAPIEGFISDLLYIKLKLKKRLFCFLSGFTYNLVQAIATVILFFTVGLSNKVYIPQLISSPAWIALLGLLASILGGVAGLLALLVYKRISNTAVVARIQGGTQ